MQIVLCTLVCLSNILLCTASTASIESPQSYDADVIMLPSRNPQNQAEGRTLLIFFDEKEYKADEQSRIITEYALTALNEQSVPFVASFNTLFSLFENSTKHPLLDAKTIQSLLTQFTQDDKTKKIKLYAQKNRDVLNVHKITLSNFVRSYIVNTFDTNRWIISAFCKDLSHPEHTLFLFIPFTYLSHIRPDIQQQLLTKRITEETFADAIGFNRAGKSKDGAVMEIKESKDIFLKRFIKPSTAQIDVQLLPALRLWIRPFAGTMPLEWIIYITGHGRSQKSIAHLPIKTFQQLLGWLQSAITTKLFICNSCHAAGVNKDTMVNDLTPSSSLTYSFPIIIMGSIGATVATILPCETAQLSLNRPTIIFAQDLLRFRVAAENDSPLFRTYYSSLLLHLFPFLRGVLREHTDYSYVQDRDTQYHPNIYTLVSMSQAPLIKPAGRQKFTPLIQTVNLSDSLINEMEKITKGEEPFNLVEYVEKKTPIVYNHQGAPRETTNKDLFITLSAEYVPLALRIESSTQSSACSSWRPFFIFSQLSGTKTLHIFHHIITNCNTRFKDSATGELIDSFVPVQYESNKTFLIQELTIRSPTGTFERYFNVIIAINAAQKKVTFYRTNQANVYYEASCKNSFEDTSKDAKRIWRIITEDYMQQYESQIKEVMTRSLQRIRQITAQSTHDINELDEQLALLIALLI